MISTARQTEQVDSARARTPAGIDQEIYALLVHLPGLCNRLDAATALLVQLG
jgi:hypothetical protein